MSRKFYMNRLKLTSLSSFYLCDNDNLSTHRDSMTCLTFQVVQWLESASGPVVQGELVRILPWSSVIEGRKKVSKFSDIYSHFDWYQGVSQVV